MKTSRDIEQEKAIECIREDLRANGKALVVAATGFGKGELIRKISLTLKDGFRLLVVVPRVNLVTDLAERTQGEIFCATLGKKNIGKITVATRQSIKEIDTDVLILDEAHNYNEAFLAKIQGTYKTIIGLTATPFRQEGFIYGDDKFWNDPCYSFGVKESIDAGYLCGYQAFSTDKGYSPNKVVATRDYTQTEIDKMIDEQDDKTLGIIQESIQLMNDHGITKAAYLTASTAHANRVSWILDDLGEENTLIHSKIKGSHEKIEEWKNNDVRSSVSVMMISEGFDCPRLDCLILLRPTKSVRLMIQSVGRALRYYEGKDFALVLDYAKVFDQVGTPINPEFDFKDMPEKEEDAERMRKCKECFYVYDGNSPICPACDFDNTVIKDHSESLRSSLLEKMQEELSSYFIYRGEHATYRGITRFNSPMLVLENKGFKVTLFGGQVRWFDNMAKGGNYVKVYFKYSKNNKSLNMMDMKFSDKEKYDDLMKLDYQGLLHLYPRPNE